MTIRTRKLIGTILLMILIAVYAVLAVAVAIVLQVQNASKLAELVYYFVAGLLWVLPAGVIIKWMSRGQTALYKASNGKIALYGAPVGGTWADVDALQFRLPRHADLSTDQGFPFDVQVVDLDRDGVPEILASNHQPDGCTPMTSSAVPGRVYALQAPPSGDLFGAPWTTHVLLDDIRPNPSVAPVTPPGRLAPGRAQAFWPMRLMEWFARPWIVVGGDEAGKAWVLQPRSQRHGDWSYDAAVVLDINDYYGPDTTQTPAADPFGRTISTMGGIAWRYDAPGPFGLAELYVPVFEARDIHVLSIRPGWRTPRVRCASAAPLACPAP